jgi:hypothetical protein
VAITNVGWLPTTVTERAEARGLCAPLRCAVEPAENVDVIGDRTQTLGQLAGAPEPAGVLGDYQFPYGGPKRGQRQVHVSFVVRGPAGSSVTISAAHPRAGQASLRVALKEDMRP